MTLSQKLQYDFTRIIETTNREPTVIVMHPDTYIELVIELNNNVNGLDMSKHPAPYNGCKIRRSYDVEKGTFEM